MNPLNKMSPTSPCDISQASSVQADSSRLSHPEQTVSCLSRAAAALANHGLDQPCFAYLVASPVGGPLANSTALGGGGAIGTSAYCIAVLNRNLYTQVD